MNEEIVKYAFHVTNKKDFIDLLHNLNQRNYHLLIRLERLGKSKLLNHFLAAVQSETVDLIIFNCGFDGAEHNLDWTTAKAFPKTRYSEQYQLLEYTKGDILPESLKEAV